MPKASAAFAAAISPFGQTIPHMPIGPMAMGMDALSPTMVVAVSSLDTSAMTCSFSASAFRSSRFRCRVSSS